jgi:hypothetical protein
MNFLNAGRFEMFIGQNKLLFFYKIIYGKFFIILFYNQNAFATKIQYIPGI